MSECQACTFDEAIWAWQPFGPGDDANVFTTLGSHYRGFTVIRVCDDCKKLAQEGSPIEFEYRGKKYIGNAKKVYEIPGYVGDPLHWWVETAR